MSELMWALIGAILSVFLLQPLYDYFKPKILKTLGKYSERQRERNERRRKRLIADVQRLVASASEREYFHFETLQMQNRFYWIQWVLFFILIISFEVVTVIPADMNDGILTSSLIKNIFALGMLLPLARGLIRYWKMGNVVDYQNEVNKLVHELMTQQSSRKRLIESIGEGTVTIEEEKPS